MTIQDPPGNNSKHPGPRASQGEWQHFTAYQVPSTTPLPVEHLLGKLFNFTWHGARTVRVLPPWHPSPPPLFFAVERDYSPFYV